MQIHFPSFPSSRAQSNTRKLTLNPVPLLAPVPLDHNVSDFRRKTIHLNSPQFTQTQKMGKVKFAQDPASSAEESRPSKRSRKTYDDDESNGNNLPSSNPGGDPVDGNKSILKKVSKHDGYDSEDSDPARMTEAAEGEETYNAELSLGGAGDGEVEIEPFNLNEERYGGGGHFDATGNYVFRRGPGDEDAWLQEVEENEGKEGGKMRRAADKKERIEERYRGDGEASDDDDDDDKKNGGDKKETRMSEDDKAVLYRVISGLLGEGETVITGIRRLGGIVDRERKAKRERRKKEKRKGGGGKEEKKEEPESDGAINAAKASFESLTEAADALINSGEKDVYDAKREDASARGAKVSSEQAGGGYFGGGAKVRQSEERSDVRLLLKHKN